MIPCGAILAAPYTPSYTRYLHKRPHAFHALKIGGRLGLGDGTFFTSIRLRCIVPSPYEVLGIDPDASEAEIEEAYRQRVKATHPDQGGSSRAFQLVRAAYDEITAPGCTPPTAVRDREGERPQRPARVQYLDYEILAERGWELDDPDLFQSRGADHLDPPACGRFLVRPDETLLQAAENRGFTWPYSCRGGACANCAVAVLDGELSMPVNHILPQELIDRGIRLSCVGTPESEELSVVFNVKHLPRLEDLRLPPRPFEATTSDD